MLWELGYQDLVANVEDLNAHNQPKDTWLKLDLKGRDPDDGLTDIPYEKGSHFLELLEQQMGREKFDKFLAKYFNEHAFKTITTEEFLTYLDANLFGADTAIKTKMGLHNWVYGPGIPANCPRADSERFTRVNNAREQFLKGTAPAQLATREWTTHEWLQFLRKMPADIGTERLGQLDKAFAFSKIGNSEIADLWFIISVRAGYNTAYPPMEQFLSSVGRRKFLEPLYGEMMKTPANAAMAKTLYEKYRKNYHPLAQESLDKMMSGK